MGGLSSSVPAAVNAAACYSRLVTVRHIVLVAAAILVAGLGVKLFYEVRASPTVEVPAEPGAQPVRDRGGAATERPRDRPVGTVKDRTGTETPAGSTPEAPRPKLGDLQQAMDESNKAYDRQDYDEAKELAQRILAEHPDNVRMRRVLVSTACMQGDQPEAQKHFDLLPMSGDARQVMRIRCKREGIVFTETGPAFQPKTP
jgi:hypothetical protein